MLSVNGGKYCDICEKKIVKDYIVLPARSILCLEWGWFEGHTDCVLNMEKQPLLIYGKPERRTLKKQKGRAYEL